jgi:hypothetical protein
VKAETVVVWREETKAYPEKQEANPEEMKSVAEHQEVGVKTVRALKDRYGDLHLAVGCRRQLQKRSQGDGGSRKKLDVACSGMNRHAGMPWRKGRCHTGLTVEQSGGNSGPGTMLQGEPRKDGRSGRDIGRNRNAATA